MNKFPFALLALLFALTLTVQAKDTGDASMGAVSATAAPYYDPATIDFKALLPDPPANDSATTKQEIDFILQKQAMWTPEEKTRIRREVNLNVYLFDTVFGPWFKEKNLPATAALFKRVNATGHPVIDSAKNYWNRPRPFLLNGRVHPPIDLVDYHVHPPFDLRKSPSYPSGHSTVGNLDAAILAVLAPDLKDAILARGRQIGDDRVIAGVHFPSDVEAGRTLAQAILTRLMTSPAFQADLAKAKAEIAAARSKT